MTNGGALLLVDDVKAHRSLVRRAIEKAGFSLAVLEAGSLGEARRLLFQNSHSPSIALAVVDLNLGDGRGTDLIREMRSSGAYQSTPIVVLSTSALEEDREESLNCGANDYLTKAGDLLVFRREVAEAVRDWLDPDVSQPS
ncbi:MAG: response regulator [Bdellovibrionales bacterium]|nr:response regulator [Bdellovibrionales bacterium]